MMRYMFAMGRVLELYMWKRWPFLSASTLDTVSHAMRQVSKAFAKAPHRQIIQMYCNAAMQQTTYGP